MLNCVCNGTEKRDVEEKDGYRRNNLIQNPSFEEPRRSYGGLKSIRRWTQYTLANIGTSAFWDLAVNGQTFYSLGLPPTAPEGNQAAMSAIPPNKYARIFLTQDFPVTPNNCANTEFRVKFKYFIKSERDFDVTGTKQHFFAAHIYQGLNRIATIFQTQPGDALATVGYERFETTFNWSNAINTNQQTPTLVFEVRNRKETNPQYIRAGVDKVSITAKCPGREENN